ncbi:hypothetical protein VB776_04250 [Arcicella sp. DC2W]|uniref:Uncharacterized protein n=1 Tax=Arcicella gelida TaxID=2984195 RepID=A0ABU5S0Y2_9BACT|nr:hypothetical protein [Arcicella sp. DC2W]MEA5402113.1 hypothetical protein [Arcicella sp. DC2W]
MSSTNKRAMLNDFGGLFNTCTSQCKVFLGCGGCDTAPCGCAYPQKSGRRYKCGECYLICRDRKEATSENTSLKFEDYIDEGKFINEVSINANGFDKIPLFVPISSNMYKGDTLPISWVAADMNTLFTKPKKKAAKLSSHYHTETLTRDYLKVDSNCTILAVLNGQDRFLENLWGMGVDERLKAFSQLKNAGFSIGTGATYSLSNLTDIKTRTPQAHNVAMLMRHHKIIDELNHSRLHTIPNIYWRDNDLLELERWSQWLISNPQVKTISRDFSSTRILGTVMEKTDELINLLRKVGRPFHIMIIGTGSQIAPALLKKLFDSGHTATVITSTPIYEARNSAIRYDIVNNKITRKKDSSKSHDELILNNLEIFEHFLLSTIDSSNTGDKYVANLHGLVPI